MAISPEELLNSLLPERRAEIEAHARQIQEEHGKDSNAGGADDKDKEKRRQVLEELTAEAQKLGMGY